LAGNYFKILMYNKVYIRTPGWRMDDQSGVDKELFDVIFGVEA
jgi:hypothetical protein